MLFFSVICEFERVVMGQGDIPVQSTHYDLKGRVFDNFFFLAGHTENEQNGTLFAHLCCVSKCVVHRLLSTTFFEKKVTFSTTFDQFDYLFWKKSAFFDYFRLLSTTFFGKKSLFRLPFLKKRGPFFSELFVLKERVSYCPCI